MSLSLLRAFCVLAFLFMFVGFSGSAHSADAPTVAIVDVEKILSESQAAKSLKSQLDAKKEAFRKEFSEKEKTLKSSETQLVSQKDKLSAEDFSKKRKEYEAKVMETRKLFQKRRNALDSGLGKAMQELRKNIVESAADAADAGGYDIVLTRDSVLIAERSLDITADVLKRLNKKVSSISLKVEE